MTAFTRARANAFAALSLYTVALALTLAPISSHAASGHHGIDPNTIDTSASPTTNFFQFANGKWVKTAKIPADLTGMGSFQELAIRNQVILHKAAEKAAHQKDAPANSPTQLVGEFYRTGLDSSLADRLGATPLKGEIERIAAIQDGKSLMAEIAHLQTQRLTGPFNVGARQDAKESTHVILNLGQGGLGLPERDYYLRTDPKSEKLRQDYVAHIGNLLTLSGEQPDAAKTDAAAILGLETRLAKASTARVDLRDPNASYHKMDFSALQTLTPEIDWNTYFTTLDLPQQGDLNVGQPRFLQEFAKATTDVPMATWQAYLRWHLLNGTAPFLSQPFVAEDFDFGRNLTGQKQLPVRWKRVLTQTNASVGEALGQLYVAEAFPPEAKRRAEELVRNVRAALRESLQHLDWMSDATKAQAIRKLDAIQVKIGYPDRWRDYSALKLEKDSYVQNVLRANNFEFKRQMAKIGQPVARDEWGMTPPTVNAYYNSSLNEIVFPAGILQPPFFDARADDASNYGGIGVVIGHELTHGFDDSGRKFDAEGNLKDWWTPEDASRFTERSDALAAQYSTYVAVDDLHVNGKLTLGENIADLGGVTIAYAALQKALQGKPKPPLIDGFTPEQRFFLSFAQIWRAVQTPERQRLLVQTDPHSPPRWRVEGTLANVPTFYQAFGTGATATPPKSVIRIW